MYLDRRHGSAWILLLHGIYNYFRFGQMDEGLAVVEFDLGCSGACCRREECVKLCSLLHNCIWSGRSLFFLFISSPE